MVSATEMTLSLTRTHKNRRLELECVTPIEARGQVKLLNRTKNRTPSHVLGNNGLCLRSMCTHVTIFSTGGKF